jgi:hypothetical protein
MCARVTFFASLFLLLGKSSIAILASFVPAIICD